MSGGVGFRFVSTGATSGFDWARAASTDSVGNVLVTGDMANPSGSTGGNAFISKYAATGNLQWTRAFGGDITGGGLDASTAGGFGVATDAARNVYATGVFYGTGDFNPGAGYSPLTSNGVADAFVVKFGLTGNLLWAQASGAGGFDRGTSISVDAGGNVTTASLSIGDSDNTVTVRRYDTNGNLIWSKQLSGQFGDPTLTTTSSGDVFLAGTFFEDFTDFDPSDATALLRTNGASASAFLTRWDSGGNFLWAHNYGLRQSSQTWTNDVVLDSSGNVFTVGGFTGTVDFDPSSAGFTRSSVNGSADVFINKVSPDGAFIFNRRIDGPGYDEGRSLALLSNNNFVVAGVFEDSFDFNNSTGYLPMTSAGGTDAFAAKFSPDGVIQWAASSGGDGYDYANGIATFNGEATVVGGFQGTADFDPDPAAVQNRTSSGDYDFFVLRLVQGDAVRTYSTQQFLGQTPADGKSVPNLIDDVLL